MSLIVFIVVAAMLVGVDPALALIVIALVGLSLDRITPLSLDRCTDRG